MGTKHNTRKMTLTFDFTIKKFERKSNMIKINEKLTHFQII